MFHVIQGGCLAGDGWRGGRRARVVELESGFRDEIDLRVAPTTNCFHKIPQ